MFQTLSKSRGGLLSTVPKLALHNPFFSLGGLVMIGVLSCIFTIAIATTLVSSLFIQSSKLVQILVALFSTIVLIFPIGLTAIAAPNSISPVLTSTIQRPDQKIYQFEEDIYISPTGDQCDGLCIAQEQTGFQRDEDLIQEINSKLPSENDLRVKVDNGAVFLSGSVKDETTARTIIKQVEAIPGVHWITVELALTNQSQSILG